MERETVAKTYTHKQLVRKAGEWLRNNGCTVVVTELVTYAGEIPDALGFNAGGGYSALIECKTSRADFLADRDKPFRREPEMGMGDERYFMAPKGLISKDEVGDWGLLEVSEYASGKLMAREAKASGRFQASKAKEVSILVSALRRLEIATCVFVRTEPEAAEVSP